MDVTLRYHALLREKTGRAEEPQALPAGATVNDALRAFFERYPALRGLEGRLHVAVDDEFAAPDDRLKPGARVDLLPPFGGG